MPADASKAIQELVAEYEDSQTPEARLAHDADKIEMLIQAIEYQALDADTRQWQDNALAALRTDAGAELACAVTSSSPQWGAAFNASYSELRASTRAHKQLRQRPSDYSYPRVKLAHAALTVSREPSIARHQLSGDVLGSRVIVATTG